ncbi:hypothetical protein KSP39_PZI023613 [Platanthera zijinensis]|uniref:Uncharacterized protein n=1 Tax=Platanthera zijinensis TaxID=2320716 RepID=A0AAP0FTS1_9ASPA
MESKRQLRGAINGDPSGVGGGSDRWTGQPGGGRGGRTSTRLGMIMLPDGRLLSWSCGNGGLPGGRSWGLATACRERTVKGDITLGNRQGDQQAEAGDGSGAIVKPKDRIVEELFLPGTRYFLRREIEERGSHGEVEAKSGEFYTLWRRNPGEHFRRIVLFALAAGKSIFQPPELLYVFGTAPYEELFKNLEFFCSFSEISPSPASVLVK